MEFHIWVINTFSLPNDIKNKIMRMVVPRHRDAPTWDPESVSYDGFHDKYGMIIRDWAIKDARSYKKKLVRDMNAPQWDQASIESNYGLFVSEGDKVVVWDKYGPITDEKTFKIARNHIAYMSYVSMR